MRAKVLLPDLLPMLSGIEMDRGNYAIQDCEIIEGCVNDIGERELLIFDLTIVNQGTVRVLWGRMMP